MAYVQKAPDGGWGWVIVFVSFSFHFLMGFIYAMNVLYGAWLDEFDQGRGLTSWVVAIFNTTQVCMGKEFLFMFVSIFVCSVLLMFCLCVFVCACFV